MKSIMKFLGIFGDLNIWLVLGTWALVLVTLMATNRTAKEITQQLELAKESLNLQWRPYLDMTFTDLQGAILYSLGDSVGVDTVFRKLSDVPVNSDSYLAVKRVRILLQMKRTLKNLGHTPLRQVRQLNATLTQMEWQNKYSKDAKRLVQDVRQMKELNEFLTDVVIAPGDSLLSDFKGVLRNMSRNDFDSLRTSGSQLILYPYSYVEYEDFRGNKYSTLRIEYFISSIITKNNVIELKEENIGLEKSRPDIL